MILWRANGKYAHLLNTLRWGGSISIWFGMQKSLKECSVPTKKYTQQNGQIETYRQFDLSPLHI